MLTVIPQLTIGVVDLVAAFLFMFGLKRMSSPGDGTFGIFVAGLGMLVAILASFLYAFDVSAAASRICWPISGLPSSRLSWVVVLLGGAAGRSR